MSRQAEKSHRELQAFFRFVEGQQHLAKLLQMDVWRRDLDKGLYIDSSVPAGYGLGSSGTVVAAIYGRYCLMPQSNLRSLQRLFANFEAHWHGQSSGLDPLVSYVQSALWLQKNKALKQVDLPQLDCVFLIDSGQARLENSGLVPWFVQQCKEESFQKQLVLPLQQAVARAIASIQEGLGADFWAALETISLLQLAYLKPMFLEGQEQQWQEGLSSGAYMLKLCGAGGGGYTLGFARRKEEAKELLAKQGLRVQWLDM